MSQNDLSVELSLPSRHQMIPTVVQVHRDPVGQSEHYCLSPPPFPPFQFPSSLTFPLLRPIFNLRSIFFSETQFQTWAGEMALWYRETFAYSRLEIL